MQRVLEMLAKMGSEMVELKHRVSEQSDTIRKLSATVYKQSTTIQGQEDLIRGLEAQVQESKEEFRQQLDQLMQKLDVSGEVALPSGPRATFADVARALPNSAPSSTRSIPGPTKQQTANDSVHCTIDTSRVSELNRNKAQIGQIRQAIEVEMRAKNGHETWRCAAVVRESRNADRVKIVCRDEAELQLVKEAAQKTAVEGARVMRDQLYPVRVDNANRTAILDTEDNILPGAIEALSAENRVTIGKISWLSKRESGKAYGSMVVYVTKKSDAERLLDGDYFDLAGESATTYKFEPRTGPIQCFNCQEIGHKQSLMNDEDLKDFVALAISEPHARNIDGKVVTSPMGHHNWTKMIPTCVRDALWPIRSMLWIRSDLEAEQVPVPSADLTAAVLRLEGREVMVVSVYVQGKNDEALTNAMELLRDVIDRFRNGTGRRTDVVLAGDFNCHDILWGGDEVSASRQGEGQPIIDLMDDYGLCSLLPRGTKTWQRSDEESTIDLVLVSAELADEVTSCLIHPTEHGSDHRAIQTTFDIRVPERTFPQRLMLKNAPWIAIATRVEDELRPLPWTVGVQTQADQLMRVVTKVLHDLTPRVAPKQEPVRSLILVLLISLILLDPAHPICARGWVVMTGRGVPALTTSFAIRFGAIWSVVLRPEKILDILIATKQEHLDAQPVWDAVRELALDRSSGYDLEVRIRDNQRRSRARRREYVQELEQRLRVYELQGIEVSTEIQMAARRAAEENKRLRELLNRHGFSDSHVAHFLQSGTFVPLDAIKAILFARATLGPPSSHWNSF
ncbi:endonuclease-reverse transcriptase domain-containing protein [Hirsutella rhossiliensis]|uniref:Endonuclease-reverse transcriptase domain-containing protein n=1 Tax=Hirsutella rhossiliensis TaxID=111463 RepID=A0A9P8MU40_9HYPO|nr:endonuclease-reverse transcriptase domain-containing protein [Hirsutella rhossiliensis]KAH0959232.1 endonuclease-reverse transcriptase domain-containing protein [Hirsutella rhossiliensis]